MKLSTITKNVGVFIKKNSPTILTAIGISGMFASTIFAVEATPKALKLIEEKKKELKVEKLAPIDTVKTVWKCYIPSAVTGVLSATCIVGANSVHAKRNAALATAYTISETALREYKDKVVETIGEKKEQMVRDAIAKDKVEKNPVSKSEVIITEKGNTLCFDPWSSRYFKSDPEKLRRAVNDLNYQLINEGSVTLNDFYYDIGLSETKPGELLGWNINRGGQVSFRFSSQIADDETPCLVLEFINPPTYDYNCY